MQYDVNDSLKTVGVRYSSYEVLTYAYNGGLFNKFAEICWEFVKEGESFQSDIDLVDAVTHKVYDDRKGDPIRIREGVFKYLFDTPNPFLGFFRDQRKWIELYPTCDMDYALIWEYGKCRKIPAVLDWDSEVFGMVEEVYYRNNGYID